MPDHLTTAAPGAAPDSPSDRAPAAASDGTRTPPRHESRLDTALRCLLAQCRVGALGTVDAHGLPSVSMVPYAIEPYRGWLVLHVSGLAAHTGHLQRQPMASLMVMQPEDPLAPVHALPRVTLAVRAHTPRPDTPEHQRCLAAYLARFALAQPMTELPDFRVVTLEPLGARHVAGFGAARSLDATQLLALLQVPPPEVPAAPHV